MMTLERYAELTTRLEREARDDPRWYRVRVACLVALAYLYIGLILGFAFALLGGTLWGVWWLIMNAHVMFSILRVAVPLTLGLIAFCFAVLRSLYVTIPEPGGRTLTREEALPLFQEIDRLRGLLKTPQFDKVILTRQLNAGVCQVPRLGLFGWQRNILMVGMPLMLVLSPDQFRAVLAHEMGHIAGDDSRFQHGVYRLNDTWRMLLGGFAQENDAANILFVPFFEWYVPFFYAYTLALRRVDEYAADKAAARAVGAEKTADMLISLALFPRRMMARDKGEPVDDSVLRKWLDEALAENDNPRDEHPCLRNRLRGVGQLNRGIPAREEQSAAQRYFDYRLPVLAESVGIQVTTEADAAKADAAQVARPPRPGMAEPDSEMPMLQPVGGR